MGKVKMEVKIKHSTVSVMAVIRIINNVIISTPNTSVMELTKLLF